MPKARQKAKGDPRSHLDQMVAILVLLIGTGAIVLLGLGGDPRIYLGFVIGIPALAYLLFRNRIVEGEGLPQLKYSARIGKLSHIVFVLSITASLWVLQDTLYYRPLTYFVLILIAAATVLLDILYVEEIRKSLVYITLAKIIVLSASLYASLFFLYPVLNFPDSWQHAQWIKETLDSRHITRGQMIYNGYYLFPIFDLSIGMISTLTSLPVHNSFLFSTGIPIAVLLPLFLFLIGKKVTNAKIALLAVLIISLSDQVIASATIILPQSLGFCLLLPMLYLFACLQQRIMVVVCLMVLSATLILAHSVSAFVALIILISVFIGSIIYSKMGGKCLPILPDRSQSPGFILLFAVAMIFWWMQTPPSSGGAVFDAFLRRLYETITVSTQLATAIPSVETGISYGITLLNQGGYLLLLSLGLIGCFSWLHYQNRTSLRVAVTAAALTLFSIIYVSILFSWTFAIVASRWFLFLYLPLGILGVHGLAGLSNIGKRNVASLTVVSVVVLFIVFIMVTDTYSNHDSPLFRNGAERLGYTSSEIVAIGTLQDMHVGPLVGDMYYVEAVPFILGPDRYLDMIS